MISLSQTPNHSHHYHNLQPNQTPDRRQPRNHSYQNQNFNYPTTASLAELDHINALASGGLPTDHMQADYWGSLAQSNPDKLGRFNHQRESSLSSMGSTGPASPYNHNISNPQIAVTDSAFDELSDMHAQDATNNQNGYYQFSKAPHTVYNNLSQSINHMAYPSTLQGPNNQHRMDRSNLQPAPPLSTGSRSHPASVASSITGDSPATPTVTHADTVENKRRKEGYGNIPKLDRTITDVYSDELYSPNFAITSTPPTQPQITTTSPSSDVFSQRLNAANNQHLNVAHSPNMVSQGRSSPFRTGSPFASVSHDFGPMPHPNGVQMNTAQRMREQTKAQQDAQMFQQQMARGRTEPETPTISPKDAVLEYHDEGDSDFPLFPQHSGNFEMDDLAKAMASQAVNQQFMHPGHNNGQLNYLPSQMPTGIQVPQQYPFVARAPTQTNSPPKLSSSGSSSASGGNTPAILTRPAGASADGGTYTCTYHGCTLRFETPTQLQKHKREGHRQTHTAPPRVQDVGMTSSLLGSQAGPHKCDRINPSTGKPCNTVFSRPYDLTRHEDTIHNARKQKVRCDLCNEEKTFSRADALTRHYRVCHPEAQLPGKQRRRGS